MAFGIAGILCGLQAARISCAWTLEGYSAVGHGTDTLLRQFAEGQGNIGFLRSHKPTVKVGNKQNSSGDGKYDDQSFGLRI